MTQTSAKVVIIDDDASVRKALRRLIRSAGMTAATYASAEEFLAADRDAEPGCLILDVQLPGMSGLDLQRRLADAGRDIAIVVITGHADQTVRRTALGAGAVDFIAKPFVRERLLGAVAKALARGEQPEARPGLIDLPRGATDAATAMPRQPSTT